MLRADEKRLKPCINQTHLEFGFNCGDFHEVPDPQTEITSMITTEYSEDQVLEKLMSRLAFTSCSTTTAEDSSSNEVTKDIILIQDIFKFI
jgi:hypothetical protein